MESTSTISFTVNNQSDLQALISLLGYSVSCIEAADKFNSGSFIVSLKTQIESILKKSLTENELNQLLATLNQNIQQMKTKGLFAQAEEIAKNSAEEFKLNLS
jgi:hypothetical protein